MNKTKISTLILFGAIVICLLAFFLKTDTLPEYNEIPKEDIVETISYDTQYYQTSDFTISYPVNWTPIDDNGIYRFVDSETAATIEISRSVYSPIVNNLDSEIVSKNITNSGLNFVNFVKRNNSSYVALYTNGNIANVEYVFWDLDTIYTIVGKYRAQDYSKVYDKIVYCIESFTWNGNKIPDGYHINYYTYGNFSIMLKDTWGISYNNDNKITISDPEYGTYISLEVFETEEDFSGITQLSFTEYSAKGKSDYIQSSYINTGTEIVANATYTINGQNAEQYQWYLANGKYQYAISVEYYSAYFDYIYDSVQLFLNNFQRY